MTNLATSRTMRLALDEACTCDPTHGQSCPTCDGTRAELVDEQFLSLTESEWEDAA